MTISISLVNVTAMDLWKNKNDDDDDNDNGYAKDEIERISLGKAAMENLTEVMKDLGFDQH